MFKWMFPRKRTAAPRLVRMSYTETFPLPQIDAQPTVDRLATTGYRTLDAYPKHAHLRAANKFMAAYSNDLLPREYRAAFDDLVLRWKAEGEPSATPSKEWPATARMREMYLKLRPDPRLGLKRQHEIVCTALGVETNDRGYGYENFRQVVREIDG